MVAEKGKKSKPADKVEDDEADHVDVELVHYIEKLQEVQDELEKVNEEAGDKVLEVEQKYNEIRRPVYVKRNEIIKTIPDFWLTAFLSHPALCDLLSEEDQKIFRHLYSLEVEDQKDVKMGYSITFNFNENPYFEDRKLEKTYTFFEDGAIKITGTTILWKDGLGASNGVNSEKKGKKRPLAEDSFFSWFGETEQKDIMELHDEVAEIIKEDLWPNPLKYFNNDIDEDEEESDGEDEEEENGDEDDDDGEE
ncbi:NAP1-related protein 2-like [Cucurbita pepo subsp. pepo]|uniref:NAP1-related protein 2-like n=1 Tax=Cucurbita pepo subsp. pepo TaxID=3664 RepID=UPI000C9D92D9|nr:NAP1-related protein 2-like [Cucurbita pepo subsp. pepo]